MILDHMNLLLPLPLDIYILVVYTSTVWNCDSMFWRNFVVHNIDYDSIFVGLTSGRTYYRFFFIVHVYHIIGNLL